MALCMNRVGLALNFVGSILIAISFGKPTSPAYQDIERSWLGKAIGLSPTRRVSLASFSYPWALWLGIVLVASGLAISLVATFSN